MPKYVTSSGREVAADNRRRMVYAATCGYWTDDVERLAHCGRGRDQKGCPTCGAQCDRAVEAHQFEADRNMPGRGRTAKETCRTKIVPPTGGTGTKVLTPAEVKELCRLDPSRPVPIVENPRGGGTREPAFEAEYQQSPGLPEPLPPAIPPRPFRLDPPQSPEPSARTLRKVATGEKPHRDEMVLSPWTADLVADLNVFQHDGRFHPYTCGSGNRKDAAHLDREGVLLATPNGWVCPFCDYRQKWVGQELVDLIVSLRAADPTSPTKKSPLSRAGAETQFVMYDGRALVGNPDNAAVLDIARSETEAKAQDSAHRGEDRVWYQYDVKEGHLVNPRIRPDLKGKP